MFYLGVVSKVAPKLVGYPAVELDERIKPTNLYKPRAWRWINVKLTLNKFLGKVVVFNFRPYSHTPWGIHKALLLEE